MAKQAKGRQIIPNDRAPEFANKFLKAYLGPSFGSLSKTETDHLVFGLLVETDAISPRDPLYTIARFLNVTPTRARNLLFQWQIRNEQDEDLLREELARHLLDLRFLDDNKQLAFGIENPLLKAALIAELKKLKIYPDTSFSREMVRLPVDRFVEFLDSLLDDKSKKKIVLVLKKEGGLPDKSFYGIVRAAVGRLANKIGDEALGELAEGAVDGAGDFLGGIVQGDMNVISKIAKSLAEKKE